MKYLIVSLTGTLLLIAATSHSVTDAFLWSERKLTWDDFRGIPDPESHADAATAIRIKAEPFYKKRKLHYRVSAWFVPSKSWCRFKTDELLAHEQLHFDIAELYARKARKKVIELEQAGETDIDAYNSALQTILNESNEVDSDYDRETMHGSLPRAQASWRFKVDVEMMLLRAY
jgi:hypothetical protein